MPGSSSWLPYAPQGVKGFDDIYIYIYIYESARTLLHLQHNLSTSEFISYFYKMSNNLRSIINSQRCALHKYTVIFLIYLLRIDTNDI